MKKTFPIVNDAACLYKWAWSTVFLSRGTTSSCHRGRHWRLTEDNFMDFKEVKTFERMCSSLSDKKNFWQTKLDVAENELLKKLLSLPI